MNWARGFLRLWAGLAICWILPLTFFLKDDLSHQIIINSGSIPPCPDNLSPPWDCQAWKQDTTKSPLRNLPVGRIITMDLKFPDGTVIKAVPEGITKAELIGKLSKNGFGAENSEGVTSSSEWRIEKIDWQARIKATTWILLPPLGLLFLGFTLAWIARGFRSSAPPEG